MLLYLASQGIHRDLLKGQYEKPKELPQADRVGCFLGACSELVNQTIARIASVSFNKLNSSPPALVGLVKFQVAEGTFVQLRLAEHVRGWVKELLSLEHQDLGLKLKDLAPLHPFFTMDVCLI
ncbi:hypothetical protein NDU88_003567 [Pleurodeles waltl]|uniref:Uncharacterized protein n=1 Tax=Pleurodeles waltl TaxID=8319 RepID=A0AAV7WSS8_PLEWA|nr:hypothetical protein NDU88_003567 [Pleurodeles waltl]